MMHILYAHALVCTCVIKMYTVDPPVVGCSIEKPPSLPTTMSVKELIVVLCIPQTQVHQYINQTQFA